MRKTILIVLSLLIVIMISVSHTGLVGHIRDTQLETITAYTQDDIIYLEGTHVFSESGIYDIECKTRNRAIEIFENLTVPDNE